MKENKVPPEGEKDNKENINKEERRKNYYLSLGISIGLCVGSAIGILLFDNIATGIGIGLCIGVAVGLAFDSRV